MHVTKSDRPKIHISIRATIMTSKSKFQPQLDKIIDTQKKISLWRCIVADLRVPKSPKCEVQEKLKDRDGGEDKHQL